jgi:hypothetical protein
MDRCKEKAQFIERLLDRKSRNRAYHHLLIPEQINHLKLSTTAKYDFTSLSSNTRRLPGHVIPF